MKLAIPTHVLASIFLVSGALAMPVAPGAHLVGGVNQAHSLSEPLQYRNPRELSHDRNRRYMRDEYYLGYPEIHGFGAHRWGRDGVGVHRQPPASSYTRRNFPYAYGDTYSYWPDQEPN